MYARDVVTDVITFPESLYTTSDLSILMHDVISLPGATSYDQCIFIFDLSCFYVIWQII